MRRSARIADAWVTDPIQGLEATKRLGAVYREEASRVGREGQVVLMRHAAVAETREQAAELYGEVVAGLWRYYWLNRSYDPKVEPWLKDVQSMEQITLDALVGDRALFGSPADCVEQTRRWIEETGADYVQVAFTPTLQADSHDRTLEQMRLFAEKVLPYVGGGGG